MMLKMIREWWTGRYESKPFRLPTDEEVWLFLHGRPRCTKCGRHIDTNPREPIVVVDDDVYGMSAHHDHCSPACGVGYPNKETEKQ